MTVYVLTAHHQDHGTMVIAVLDYDPNGDEINKLLYDHTRKAITNPGLSKDEADALFAGMYSSDAEVHAEEVMSRKDVAAIKEPHEDRQ